MAFKAKVLNVFYVWPSRQKSLTSFPTSLGSGVHDAGTEPYTFDPVGSISYIYKDLVVFLQIHDTRFTCGSEVG